MTEKVKQHAAPVTGSDEIDIGRLVGTVTQSALANSADCAVALAG